MFDAIVCGSLHLDIMVKAPRLPVLDETLPGTGWGQQCGGKGGNQAVMAARMGARTAMIGCVGDDPFGRRLIENLRSNDVDTRAVIVDQAQNSGMSVALVDEHGGYGAVIVSGANLSMSPDAMASAWRELGSARYLILQNEIPEEVNIAVARAARKVGAKVLLNAAPARDVGNELYDLVDIVIANRVEAAMLTGRTVITSGDAKASLPLLSEGQRAAIVTLGERGLVGVTASGAGFEIAAVPVPVVSTHGAGDAFIGALVARLVQGDPLPGAAAAANAAAARHVSGGRD